MRNVLRELRYALRQLRRSPGFTLTAALTLAFGIGATTAIFSIVEGVLLRPLPFPDPSRLVLLADIVEGVDYGGDTPGVTAPGVRTYMRDTTAFSGLGSYQPSTYELSGAGDPVQIGGAQLTANLFPVLGVPPLMGRGFTQKEDDSRAPVTVLSYQMWQSRFHGEPNILGQKILLDRKPYEIVGVMPRDFEFPLVPGRLNRSELWVPMSLTPDELQGQGGWSFYLVGRLRPGVTPTQAQQDATGAAREIMRNFPPALSRRHIHPLVQPLDEATVAQARPLVRTLFFSVMVVLFIACANLAGLLLVRVDHGHFLLSDRHCGRGDRSAPESPGVPARAAPLRRPAWIPRPTQIHQPGPRCLRRRPGDRLLFLDQALAHRPLPWIGLRPIAAGLVGRRRPGF